MEVSAVILGTIKKRPFAFLFFGMIILLLSILDYYNPVFPILLNFNLLSRGDFLTIITAAMQMIFSFFSGREVLINCVLIPLSLLAALAVMAGIIFAGYFNVINNYLDGKPGYKGEFLQGVKKYFVRIFSITFRVMLLGIIFVVFISIVSVPAVVVTTSAVSGKGEFFWGVVLLDIITLLVVFFGFMFFQIYSIFWFPSAVNHEKGTFKMGKRTVDSGFWRVLRMVLVFDLIFVTFQIIVSYISHVPGNVKTGTEAFSLLVFILGWLFKTLFYTSFIICVFSTFKFLQQKNIDNKLLN